MTAGRATCCSGKLWMEDRLWWLITVVHSRHRCGACNSLAAAGGVIQQHALCTPSIWVMHSRDLLLQRSIVHKALAWRRHGSGEFPSVWPIQPTTQMMRDLLWSDPISYVEPGSQIVEMSREVGNGHARSSSSCNPADTRDQDPASTFDYLLWEPRHAPRLRRMNIGAGIVTLVVIASILYGCT
jgi:hypothetical protein